MNINIAEIVAMDRNETVRASSLRVEFDAMKTENPQSSPEPLKRKAARSLALHVLIAQKVTENPALLERARGNLERWSIAHGPAPAWIAEWREILNRPWREIAALITDPGPEAARLRKSSPFTGIMSPEERLQIFEKFTSKGPGAPARTAPGEGRKIGH
ncbi:MAG TPA: hypothetical protein VIY90_14555 [Steroidobacteraceae bacterium]